MIINTKKLRVRNEIKSEINVVPFLDILLVLLIILMIMPSEIIQQGIEVNLPDSEFTHNFNVNKKYFLTIEILDSKLYNIIANNIQKKHICWNQLILEIKSQINTYPNLVCFIAASKSTQYNEIVKLLNILNTNKIHSIGMVTNPIFLND